MAGEYVERAPLQLALREIRAHFTDRRVLGGMAVIAVLLGFLGPFGTADSLALAPRLAYWAAIVAAGYGLGYAASILVLRLLRLRIRAPWAQILVFGSIAGIPVTIAVALIHLVTFGRLTEDLPALWLQCTLIGLGVVALLEIFEPPVRGPTGTAAEPAGPPPIVLRLPLPQRGTLISLSVEDHYVEVVTDRGRGLVLIRLGDAIRETAGVAGLQIHRSHWVALAAVTRLVRSDGKPVLELSDGRRLPVSRSYVDAVRAAFLGRSGADLDADAGRATSG